MKTNPVKWFTLFLLLLGVSATGQAGELTLNGAGATFPYPVYAQWGYQYNQVTGVKLNYQSIGSGGGIAQIKAKTVDFGASDAPLTEAELSEAGLMQFPMVIGGVVPVIHVPEIPSGQLKISAGVLADIYLGKVTKWNDKAIAGLNPGLTLPDKAITVVHRADGSGTTWIFTTYLAGISEEWKTKVGADKAVAWPAGIGGKGNEGVAAYVQRVNGAIGYVEYAYAIQNKMNHVQMQNRDGKFVSPTSETFQAAAANADWEGSPGYHVVLTNQPGENSWPITGASFILLHKAQSDPIRAKAVLSFFDWSYKNGTDTANKLHYISLPANVVEQVQKKWTALIKSGKQAEIWP